MKCTHIASLTWPQHVKLKLEESLEGDKIALELLIPISITGESQRYKMMDVEFRKDGKLYVGTVN